MNRPSEKVSLVIPCFNGAVYLPALLASLDNQTSPPDELIVVDDGSTDGSREILTSAAGITLIVHDSNRGLSEARNSGIAVAHGDLIVFVDVDTTLPERFMERFRNCLRLYPDVAGIGGRADEVNIISCYDEWRRDNLIQSFGEAILLPAPMLWGVCSSYRKDVLDRFGGFRSEFTSNAEDVDLGLRLVDAGLHLLYHPAIRVNHHKSDTDSSLEKTVYRWYYWGARAWRRNRRSPLPGLVKTLSQQAVALIGQRASHSREYSRLSTRLFLVKLRAVRDACVPRMKPPAR
jgi:GT2 family glycosyltransferase